MKSFFHISIKLQTIPYGTRNKDKVNERTHIRRSMGTQIETKVQHPVTKIIHILWKPKNHTK